jgi:hypothetical protein
LLSFRGASAQSELDAFLSGLGSGACDLVSDRALAKAQLQAACSRAVGAQSALDRRCTGQDQLPLFKGRRRVCALAMF